MKSIDTKTDEEKINEIVKDMEKRQYKFGNDKRDMRIINRGVKNILSTRRYLARLLGGNYRKAPPFTI